MADTRKDPMVPELGFWERTDARLGQLNLFVNVLYAAITGVFRGKSSPKAYKTHLLATAIRTMVDRFSARQVQYLSPPTPEIYKMAMEKRGLQPEVMSLPHGTDGYWLGNKNAKNVVIYYHGGGFVLAAVSGHFEFLLDLLKVVNDNGHDIAVFFPRYTQAPYGTYPTQLRQAAEALRYILNDTGRSPSNIIVGGDSAGGNLAMAVLLHLSHPHPEIDPISVSTPLAGVFGFAPWVNFSTDWPSFKENAYKDFVTERVLNEWSATYIGGKDHDPWSEPDRAPVEWWADVKTERILILAGSDEILLSPIESFAKKVKSVFPNTTLIVGADESHDMPFFGNPGPEGTPTGRELRQWIASRL
ncbi:hypothetical protein N7532_011471 [Penicillium argentinense]|uniref:Alpha/beta hydrolase fold-3 domain-containing protein n=1 Tax=Penicillium argentinense TaxID=1131581 RepID=A0A9W9EIF6_9EURO|nr:uncharacterized protein N7532_011471 [Penicillium argentinense]KAJ5082428.1 hypothetical protein N7532_011471 [Penicillium argentinense]